MRTQMDNASFRELTSAILKQAHKDKDSKFFETPYAEDLCSVINLNAKAVQLSLTNNAKKVTSPKKRGGKRGRPKKSFGNISNN